MSRAPWSEAREIPAAPPCETPIAEVPEGAPFYIAPAIAAGRGFCLAVGKEEAKPSKVKLAKITGDDRQKWTLEDGDAFRNVATGEYLDADTQYAFTKDAHHPWDGNHSDLRTAPRSLVGTQKWVFGPESFHGGLVLRHYLDGRGVDVHGWQFKDGGNMGVENSVHGDCKGISYTLRLCEEVNLEKPEEMAMAGGESSAPPEAEEGAEE